MATAATLVTGRAQVERCQHYPDESPFVQVINEQVRSEGSNGYLSEVVVVSGLTGAMANRALHAFKGSTWNSESKRLVLGKRQTHMDVSYNIKNSMFLFYYLCLCLISDDKPFVLGI